MSGNVEKREVEHLLGCRITKEQFEEALVHAKQKQKHLFQKDGNPAMLQDVYLAKLTEEYARGLALSDFTRKLYRISHNMEKEHLTKSRGAQIDNHIVSVPAS